MSLTSDLEPCDESETGPESARRSAAGCGQLQPLDVAQWQEFAESRPDRSVFHHRWWIELLEQQYGLSHYLPGWVRGGEIVAAVPFLRTTSITGRRRYVSLPFTDTVHALAQDGQSRRELLAALRADARLQQHGAAVMRTSQPLCGESLDSQSVEHRLNLSRPLNEIRARFDDALKRNIRRAERNGLQFSVHSDPDSLEAFYRLHVATRRKLGVPVQPIQFFRTLQRQIIARGLGVVGLVSMSGTAIAGGVYLGYNRVLTAKYLASDPRALAHRPNEWLMFSIIEWAVERGFARLDMGLSDRQQTGLRRFKQKWGAEEGDIFQECIAGTDRKRLGPHPRLLQLAGVVIRHSPQWVCRGLGEMFYRYTY
jgi:CelD/BcsL family acetyltransferase involved in cellulose biosynthesis